MRVVLGSYPGNETSRLTHSHHKALFRGSDVPVPVLQPLWELRRRRRGGLGRGLIHGAVVRFDLWEKILLFVLVLLGSGGAGVSDRVMTSPHRSTS
jgi:hypothetical protein